MSAAFSAMPERSLSLTITFSMDFADLPSLRLSFRQFRSESAFRSSSLIFHFTRERRGMVALDSHHKRAKVARTR
jgi:hypothetical protein